MNNEIVWLEQKEFWERFNSLYLPKKRFLNCWGWFYCELDTLKSIAKLPPVYTPAEEEDFAGPVERWYCEVSGNLFLLTYYYSDISQVVLRLEDNDQMKNKIISTFKVKGIELEFSSI